LVNARPIPPAGRATNNFFNLIKNKEMSVIISSMTIDQQFQNAKFLLSKLKNQSGQLMFPTKEDLEAQTIVQHTLRSEVKLTATATQFTIPVTVQNNLAGVTFPTENRLAINDIFVCVDFNVSVCKPSSDTDTEFRLFNYGSPTVFTTANTAAAINSMYNKGYIQWINKQKVVAPHWDLLKHYKVPNQQAQSHPNYAANNDAMIDEYDGGVDGFYPTSPNWIFNGAGNINMQLILPSALAAVETYERLVVQYRGFLLQNSSQVQ
jgi:hypothetical protein